MVHSSYVVDLMSSAPVVVGPETRVSAAADHAARHDVHYLMVIDGYRLRGVVCSCDLQGANPDRSVADCMHSPPITVEDQATGEECAEIMRERAVGCLPVVDWSGALAGVVTRHDLRLAGLHPRSDRCASCNSSHGIVTSPFEDSVVFCRRCLDQGCSATSEDNEAYFTLGGGD